MSSPCNKLLRIWQTQRRSTTRPIIPTASPAAVKPRRSPPLSSIDLFKEPNVEVMASKFKVKSTSYYFRCKTNVYSYAIGRLAKLKRFSTIEDILETHKNYSDITKEGYAARLISFYGDAGMFDHAHKLFDELPDLNCNRKTMAFNSLLGAALHSKEYQRAVEIFHKYPLEMGFKPNVVSYNTVIRALGALGLVDEALSMVDQMMAEDLELNLVTFNALMSGAYATKGFSEGEKIWQLMLEKKSDLVPDIRSYNCKLQGMIKDGMMSEAVDLFNDLRIKGLEPNPVTYNHMIKGICDEGDLEEAKKWYKILVDSAKYPNADTFNILIRLFCENDDSDLALDLCKRILGRYFVVDQDLLQMVVNLLVKDSKIEQAKKLVEAGRSNVYCQYDLVMPSETWIQNGKTVLLDSSSSLYLSFS